MATNDSTSISASRAAGGTAGAVAGLRAPGGSRDHRKAIFSRDQRLPGASTIRPALAGVADSRRDAAADGTPITLSPGGISAIDALLPDLSSHFQRLGCLVKSA